MARICLSGTCRIVHGTASGPSVDFVAGQRALMRGGRSSILRDERFNQSLVALLGRVCGPQSCSKLGKAVSQ